jgi:A/G-specific adenine glycosylase
MGQIADRLLPWFDLHGRKHLPWQQNVDGYRVWLSEIMLQQTQVSTVIPYFERFIRTFPDIVSLADAELDQVLALWSGLGYYARARNLHRAAIQVRDEHAGRFPQDYESLLTLPGIGRSTAGAILSLAYGQRAAILDGNVKRVLARVYRVQGWPGQSATLKKLWYYAEAETPGQGAGAYNQAMMDLGATLCTRSKPRCEDCPLVEFCQAYQFSDQADFPQSRPRQRRRTRQCWMLLHRSGDQLLLEQRPASGIWGGLYSLPELDDLAQLEEWQTRNLGVVSPPVQTEKNYLLHKFSHFDLQVSLALIDIERGVTMASRVAESAGRFWIGKDEIETCPLPAPVRTILRTQSLDR